MLRTTFENNVLEDAYNWFATTDEFKIHWSNLEELKKELLDKPESVKQLVSDYWDWYLNS
jgi:hypothetical protein